MPAWIAHAFRKIGIMSFFAIAAGNVIKMTGSPEAVLAEFHHPTASKMFGTPLIGLLLLPMAIEDVSLLLARAVWFAAALAMTLFAAWTVSRWLGTKQSRSEVSAAWIMPVVGMIDIPLAMPALGLESLHGVPMFALSVGLFFAFPLFTMIFARPLFEDALPGAMLPSNLILSAPFSVGFSAYVATTGQVDGFSAALYMVMLFLLLVLLANLRDVGRSSPFKLAWWAASFPLAAAASASIRYAQHTSSFAADVIALSLLALASGVITGLAIRTLLGLTRHELEQMTA